MHEQAPMNDSVSEKEKSDLDVFPPTAASNVITDMIPVLVFGFSRVIFYITGFMIKYIKESAFFCLSCFSYIFLFLKVLILFQSVFC